MSIGVGFGGVGGKLAEYCLFIGRKMAAFCLSVVSL